MPAKVDRRLGGIRKVALELDARREGFHDLIRTAHDEGISLRVIAEAAGVSHEQVRRIIGLPR